MIKGSLIGGVLYNPPSITQILQDKVTRKVFDKLVKQGVGKKRLSDALRDIPVMPRRLGYLFSGNSSKRAKAKKKFLQQVEDLASEIERFNTRTWLLTEITDRAKKEARPPRDRQGHQSGKRAELDAWLYDRTALKMLNAFRSLPDVLRAYEAHFDSAVHLRRPDTDLEKILIIELLNDIKTDTKAHRCYFADLSQLLGAAFFAAGRPRSREYTADGLRKLYASRSCAPLEATIHLTLPENYWPK